MNNEAMSFELEVLKERVVHLEKEAAAAKESHAIRCSELQEMTRVAQDWKNKCGMNVQMGQELCERLADVERRRGGECSECGKWVCPPLTCYACQKTPLANAMKDIEDLRAALELIMKRISQSTTAECYDIAKRALEK